MTEAVSTELRRPVLRYYMRGAARPLERRAGSTLTTKLTTSFYQMLLNHAHLSKTCNSDVCTFEQCSRTIAEKKFAHIVF